MNPIIITILLFVPFILVAGITGTIFFISGYKKGLYRSLVSLGITVVAVLLSIILSNLTALALSGVVCNLIPKEMFAEMGALASFAENLVQSFIKVALAFAFFSIFLLIGLIVLKLVGNKINWDKLDMADPENKKLKLAGMGIRAIDTLLVAFMLLLPFYGTISLLTPTFVVVSSSSTGEMNTVRTADAAELSPESTAFDFNSTLNAIDSHPLVAAYKAGPGDWVMRSLSDMGKDTGNLNAVEAAKTLGEAVTIINSLSNVDTETRYQLLSELCVLLEEKAVHEDWCYDFVNAIKTELEAQLKLHGDADTNDAAEIKAMLDLFNMTREEFESTASTVLKFIPYAIENGFIDFYKTSDYSLLSNEFYTKLGELLNSGKQIIAAKKLIYTEKASVLFEGLNPDGFYSEEDLNNAKNKAHEFVNKYFGDGKVDKKDYAKEGEAFMIIFFDFSYPDMIDAFLRHPLFGSESVEGFVDSKSAGLMFPDYYVDYESDIYKHFESNEKVTEILKKSLKTFENTSITEDRFSHYMYLITSTEAYLNNVHYEYLIHGGAVSLEMMLAEYDSAAFASRNVAGAEAHKFLTAYAEMLREKEIPLSDSGYNLTSLIYVLNAAKDTSLWPESKDSSESESNIYDRFFYEVSMLVNNYETNIIPDTLGFIIEKNGTDPFGLSKNLSAEEKALFKQLLDDIKANEDRYAGGSIDLGNSSSSITLTPGSNSGSTVIINPDAGIDTGELIFDGEISIEGGNGLNVFMPTEEEIQAQKDKIEKNSSILMQFFGI